MTMIPKIRFSEFEEEWKETTINEISTSYSGGTPSAGEPQYYGGNIPFIRSGEIHNDKTELFLTEEGLSSSAAKMVSKGTILYALYGATSGEVAISQIDGAINQAILAICVNEKNDSKFVCCQLEKEKKNIVGTYLQGGQGNLSGAIIKNFKIATPTLSEQRRISQFFTLLDETIRLEGERLSSLKQVKAASLQSFFPQEGEKEPRVRFKGFSGEWKKVKLSECLEISTERNLDNFYGKNDVLSVSEELGVRNQIELLGRSYAGQSVTNYNVLRTNQIVYTKSPLKSKPYGIVKVNKGETGIVSVLYAVYNVKEGISPDYIHWYFTPNFRLNNYLHPLVNKGAKNTMNISDEDALKGEIMIPSTLAEQCALSTYFTNIDEQIRLVSEKIEKMKKVKGACLEGMMV